MRHTVIAWDSSYRNFFHLVQGITEQDYDRDEYELIYVEQRSQEHADTYASDAGVSPLSEVAAESEDDLNIQVAYLDDPLSSPYHLGKCVNRGFELAKGEIVSVMDGDQLLPPNFLTALDRFHADGPAVANVIRRSAAEPIGATKENWKQAEADFEKCLEASHNAGEPIAEATPNYGPLISAPATAWEAINYYSTHKIWATGLSQLGADANARLERHLGVESRPLPDTVATHPWHPSGFDRNVHRNRTLLELQADIIDYSDQHDIVDWTDRREYTEQLYEENRAFVDQMHADESLAVPGTAESTTPSTVDVLRRDLSALRAELTYNGPRSGATYLLNRVRQAL